MAVAVFEAVTLPLGFADRAPEDLEACCLFSVAAGLGLGAGFLTAVFVAPEAEGCLRVEAPRDAAGFFTAGLAADGFPFAGLSDCGFALPSPEVG